MGDFEVAVVVIGIVSVFVAVMVILTIGMVEATRARISPTVIIMALVIWTAQMKGMHAYAAWLGGTVRILQTLGEQMPVASQFGSFLSLLNAVLAAGFAALLVQMTRGGFNRWSARAAWRRWLRIPLAALAGIGVLPFCFSIVTIYVAQTVAPAAIGAAWMAGLGLGVMMTVWLVFARAPRVQTEMAAPQS